MTRITVNDALRSWLLSHSEAIDLCDETGRVLGRFFPVGTTPNSLDDPDYVLKVLEKHKGSTPNAAKELGISLKTLYTKLALHLSRITLTETIRLQLQNCTQPLELWGTSGDRLGCFVPPLEPYWVDLEPQISEEELQRRRQSTERTYTTAEVLARLENRCQ